MRQTDGVDDPVHTLQMLIDLKKTGCQLKLTADKIGASVRCGEWGEQEKVVKRLPRCVVVQQTDFERGRRRDGVSDLCHSGWIGVWTLEKPAVLTQAGVLVVACQLGKGLIDEDQRGVRQVRVRDADGCWSII